MSEQASIAALWKAGQGNAAIKALVKRIQLLEEQQAADAAIIRSMEQEIREIGFETGVR